MTIDLEKPNWLNKIESKLPKDMVESFDSFGRQGYQLGTTVYSNSSKAIIKSAKFTYSIIDKAFEKWEELKKAGWA